MTAGLRSGTISQVTHSEPLASVRAARSTGILSSCENDLVGHDGGLQPCHSRRRRRIVDGDTGGRETRYAIAVYSAGIATVVRRNASNVGVHIGVLVLRVSDAVTMDADFS